MLLSSLVNQNSSYIKEYFYHELKLMFRECLFPYNQKQKLLLLVVLNMAAN